MKSWCKLKPTVKICIGQAKSFWNYSLLNDIIGESLLASQICLQHKCFSRETFGKSTKGEPGEDLADLLSSPCKGPQRSKWAT